MIAIQPTLTITADDQVIEVGAASDQIRQLVAYMDDWRQKEADVSSELLLTRGGIRDIQNALLAAIRQERADAAAKVAAEAQAAANVAAAAAAAPAIVTATDAPVEDAVIVDPTVAS